MPTLRVVILLTEFALAACESCVAPNEVVIGVVSVESGSLAEYGEGIVRAVSSAVDEVNPKGGIGGLPVRLITADDGCDPVNAATVAASLVSEGVLAVIGHLCSDATDAALPI